MCYKCGRPGHFTRDCHKKQSSCTSQMQDEESQGWNNHELEIGYPTLTVKMEQSTISQACKGLKVMTLKEKNELASELGVGEDFTLA
jgi:hypothetical protein